MIFKAFTQGTLVRERGPEARATGCVAQRGPEARATGVLRADDLARRGYQARSSGVQRSLAPTHCRFADLVG